MKKVLLTGIGGSIGIHTFIHIMKNTDWYVIGIDSFNHKGWCDRVSEVLKKNPEWQDRLLIITHDLAAPFSEIAKRKIGNPEYIISMASLSDVEASIQNPVSFIQNNVNIALNVLELARESKPEMFIQISTDEVYGPARRDQSHPEWSPILPSNPYAASKAAQEAIAISYWRSYSVPVVITNTMNNFGEMQQDSKYPVKIQKLIEKGEKVIVHGTKENIGTRFYLHSRTKSDALLYIMKNLPAKLHVPGEIDMPDRYNIVGERQVDNLELAKTIANLMGKELKYELLDYHSTRPGHDIHYGLDGTKLKELGWCAPMTFEESLKKTIEWQRDNPEWIN